MINKSVIWTIRIFSALIVAFIIWLILPLGITSKYVWIEYIYPYLRIISSLVGFMTIISYGKIGKDMSGLLIFLMVLSMNLFACVFFAISTNIFSQVLWSSFGIILGCFFGAIIGSILESIKSVRDDFVAILM